VVYHLSKLGKYAQHVAAYADLNGFVPERGDARDGFTYPDAQPIGDWGEFVSNAIAAAIAAEADLEADRDAAIARGEIVFDAADVSSGPIPDFDTLFAEHGFNHPPSPLFGQGQQRAAIATLLRAVGGTWVGHEKLQLPEEEQPYYHITDRQGHQLRFTTMAALHAWLREERAKQRAAAGISAPGRKVKNPASRKQQVRWFVLPATIAALEAYALEGETLGSALDRLVATTLASESQA
jgi:hypothetical protein